MPPVIQSMSKTKKRETKMEESVGVFWIFENRIYFESQSVNDIEAIHCFKDSDLSHYEVWEKIRKQNPSFYLYEYEEIPRGRMVYQTDKRQFIVYCNENILQNKESRGLILANFHLIGKDVIFKEDEHYYRIL